LEDKREPLASPLHSLIRILFTGGMQKERAQMTDETYRLTEVNGLGNESNPGLDDCV